MHASSLLRAPLIFVSALLLGALATSGLATVAPTRDSGLVGPAPGLIAPPVLLQATGDETFRKEFAAQDSAFTSFTNDVGGTWWARHDRRTGRPALIWGSGLPWLPGRGNTLDWKSLGVTPDDPAQVLGLLKRRARRFLDEQSGLFRIPPGAELVLDEDLSVSMGNGRLHQLWFALERDEVRLVGAGVFFRVSSGNLVQFGTSFVGDNLSSAPTVPALSSSKAMERATSALVAVLSDSGVLPRAPGATLAVSETLDAGSLSLMPWSSTPADFNGPPGEGLAYRLTWRFEFRLQDRLETWLAIVDAVNGEILTLHDDNKYECELPLVPQGRVVGGVYLGAVEEVSETVRGMPHASVENGVPRTTDFNGLFPYDPASPATASLDGQFFNVLCVGCTAPGQASVSQEGTGALKLGTGGDDNIGNGWSTRPERNCFYHLSVVRQLATKHLTDVDTNGYLSRQMPAVVNIDSTCNAFWNGDGVNFFRSSDQCNNTGDIADVMQHEWGHGLDQFTGRSFDSARGEGMSDVVAFLSTHDPRLGPYFVRGNPGGIRNADEFVSGRGVLTLGNVASICPGGFGPAGAEVHCEGEVFSQTFWHLARTMREKSVAAGGSEAAGWYATERLFFESLPFSDTYIPDQATSVYDAVVLVDDDDGNLANGTPNGALIDEAFDHHEIASTPLAGDSADCTPPEAPTLTLVTRGNPNTELRQIDVSWTPTPFARRYELYRNDNGGLGAELPIATIFPPDVSYLDDNVTDGVTYAYRVSSFDAAGCASVVENEETITVSPLLSLAFSDLSLDDSMANDNGVADRGERLVLNATVLNDGLRDANAVLGTLTSSHPGVQVVTGSADFGDLAAGESADTPPPFFVIDLADTMACGESFSLILSLESAEGCVTTSFSMEVSCEAPFPRPRLEYLGASILDDAAGGGFGNGNGFIDPGEVVRLPMELRNFGNTAATEVSAALYLSLGPAGLVVGDAEALWSDIAISATETSGAGNPQHQAIVLPEEAACGSMITLVLVVSYEGPAARYDLVEFITFEVGRGVDTVFYLDDFEGGDNGFTHGTNCGACNPEDDWERRPPASTSGWDPVTAYSGDFVWGNDLGGAMGGGDGNYGREVNNFLESPQFDATGLSGVMLSYQRWLTVEAGRADRARVLINGDQVWRNEIDDHHLDQGWVYQEVDISAEADDSLFRVRFELQSGDRLEAGGWTIDDMQLFTRQQVCEGVVPPSNETDCMNGIDDDRDGLVDCEDDECPDNCPETVCDDGLDEDGDGLTDCADPDCDGAAACAARLAVNRQAVLAPGAAPVPSLAVLNDPACAAVPFTLCTDGGSDEVVFGALDGLRLSGEAVPGQSVLWLYQHSDATTTMRIERAGNDLVFRAN